MTVKNLQENKLIFEAYKAKVIKEDLEKWQNHSEIPLELHRRPPTDMDPENPGYFVTGEVTFDTSDDSDFDRESGYGQLTHNKVADIEVTTVDYLNTEGVAVDITDTLTPEELVIARDTLQAAWERDPNYGQ